MNMRHRRHHIFCALFLILLIPVFSVARVRFTQYGVLPAVLQSKKVVKTRGSLGAFRSFTLTKDMKKPYQKQYDAHLMTDHCELSGELKIVDKCPVGASIPLLGVILAPAGSCKDQARVKVESNSCAKKKPDGHDGNFRDWENSIQQLAFVWKNVLRGAVLHEWATSLLMPPLSSLTEIKSFCRDAKYCNLGYGMVKRIDREDSHYTFVFSTCTLSVLRNGSVKAESSKEGDCVIRTEVMTDENLKSQHNPEGYEMRVLGIRFAD